MGVVLVKRDNGRAAIMAAIENGPNQPAGDYSRRLFDPDEIIEGKRVADYLPGVHPLKALPLPLPTNREPPARALAVPTC